MSDYNVNSRKVSPNGRSNHQGVVNRSGVAKLSHFMLTFTAPLGTPLGAAVDSNILRTFQQKKQSFVGWESEGNTNLAFRCERTTLPGRVIITSPFKEGNYGLNREYPTNAVYQPVDATFLMSEDYSEKIFFELWQDLIVGHVRTHGDTNPDVSTKELNYLKNYTCDVTIHAFSEVGGTEGFKEVYNLTLKEAYPRTIQDLQMDWTANDLVRLNVVFDYKYFEDGSIRNIESSAKPRQGSFLNRTGLGAAIGSLGGRAISGLSPRTQQAVTGVVSGANAVRVASKLFF
tara:strand:+ start:518 stop:1381 length:864 start_codon:yes stop_codon:yes gene_type:complete